MQLSCSAAVSGAAFGLWCTDHIRPGFPAPGTDINECF